MTSRRNSLRPAVLRLRADPDDRVRQRRQSAPRARRLAPAGDRHPTVAWRVTPAHHPAAAHGEPPAGARGGGMRLLSSRSCFSRGALSAAMTTIPPEFVQFVSLLNLAAPAADWRVLMFLVAGAVVSTVFFGLAPALQATRLDLVRTMRGEVTRDARPRRARQTLIAVQVGASALLLICAAIFLRGAFAAATQDPGVRTSDTLTGLDRDRNTARRDPPGPEDPSVGGDRGRVVAADAWSHRNVRAAEQNAGRPAGRVVRVLHRARPRFRERARLHAGGTHGGGRRRGRVPEPCAPALAERQRRGAGGAPRGSTPIGVDAARRIAARRAR